MSQKMRKSELNLHFLSLTHLVRTHTSRFFKWKGKRKKMKERRDEGKGTSETGLTSRDKEGQHCRKAWSWPWLPDYLHKTSPSNISTKSVLQESFPMSCFGESGQTASSRFNLQKQAEERCCLYTWPDEILTHKEKQSFSKEPSCHSS